MIFVLKQGSHLVLEFPKSWKCSTEFLIAATTEGKNQALLSYPTSLRVSLSIYLSMYLQRFDSDSALDFFMQYICQGVGLVSQELSQHNQSNHARAA